MQMQVVYDGSFAGQMYVPGILNWSYTTAQDKNRIVVGRNNAIRGRPTVSAKSFLESTGMYLQLFMKRNISNKFKELTRSCRQVMVHAFLRGWAWNQGVSHNHYKEGPDGKWGVANNDDDNNGTVDDAVVQPPFEPVKAMMKTLSHPNWSTWLKG